MSVRGFEEMQTVYDSLDTSIADEQLRKEVEAYANGPRHSVGSSETAELLAQLRQENSNRAKHVHFDKEDELRKVRLGHVLTDKEFITRLNKIAPAKYTGQTHGLLRLSVLVPTENGGEWRFICGAQAGYVPEYSTMYFNEYGAPTSEMYRGWRTVLLRCILNGAISEAQATKEFGIPDGPQGRRYRETLYNFRNRKEL